MYKMYKYFLIAVFSSQVVGLRYASAQLPQLGAMVWLEDSYSKARVDSLFMLMADNHLKVARIFFSPGNADLAFASAEKYGVKIQATFRYQYPNTDDDLVTYAQEINRLVKRYKNSHALETWWLMNEPGGYSSTPFAIQRYRKWLKKKYVTIDSLNRVWGEKYPSFNEMQFDVSWTMGIGWGNPTIYSDWFQFSKDNLTWIQEWIANEVKKEDTVHQFHVNPAGIISDNLIYYDFPAWRGFLTSLGASIHPAHHFGMLKPEQFALGIAATCDIIKGGSEPNPFWVSELQAGNNTWSAGRPIGPTANDIAQWTWTSIGCGAEKVIYWLLNNMSRGTESGEWSMLDFQGKPSDRLEMASKISQTINSEQEFFSGAKPLDRKVVILLSPESIVTTTRKASTGELGRSKLAHILSALSYYQTLSELGIPAIFKYTDDFDWEHKTNCIAIFPNAVSVPQQVVKRAEAFVDNGNKLIIDGLTGCFDENEVNVLQTGFFFENLCGATIRDIRTIDHLFTAQLENVSTPLPVNLWQTEILNHHAKVIGKEGDRVTAVRNKFGKGEVVWVPMLIGLGAWLDKNDALSEFLANETSDLAATIPIKFKQKTNNVIIQTLEKGNDYVSVITNGSDEVQEVALQLNKKLTPVIIFNTNPGNNVFSLTNLKLLARQTMVVKFSCKENDARN
jgi:beta-galactosidase